MVLVIFLLPFIALSLHKTKLIIEAIQDAASYSHNASYKNNMVLSRDQSGPWLYSEVPYQNGFSDTWQTGAFGRSIGEAGLIAYDIDGDGELEIIIGATESDDISLIDLQGDGKPKFL